MDPSEAVSEVPAPGRPAARRRVSVISSYDSPTGSCIAKDFARLPPGASAADPRQALRAEIDALLRAQHERLASEILSAVERSPLGGEAERHSSLSQDGDPAAEVGGCAKEAAPGGEVASLFGGPTQSGALSDFGTQTRGRQRSRRNTKRLSWFSLDKDDRAQEEKARSVHSIESVTLPESESRARKILASPVFEAFVTAAIISNSLLIGAEVEYLAQHPGEDVPDWLYGVTHAYTFLFFAELVARMAVHGAAFFCAEDWAWNLFDVAVVTSSLVELGIDLVGLLHDAPSEQMHNISNIRVIRVLRITRIIRTVRLARIVRFITALRLLVLSILATLRSLVWAVVLMAIIVYIFAIVFTQSAQAHLATCDQGAAGAGGCPGGGGAALLYWGSLWTSMFTLFQSITGGVNWEVPVGPLGHMSWALVWLFALFIFTINFAVLNVITGFFCQAANEAASHDPEVIVQSMLSDDDKCEAQITKLFNSLDTHGTGKVTYLELRRAMKDKRVQAHFKGLNVAIADTWTLFKLINSSKTNLIDLEEFIMGCMRLQGNAKSVHIEKLASDQRWFMKNFSKSMHGLERQLEQISQRMYHIGEPGPRVQPSVSDESEELTV